MLMCQQQLDYDITVPDAFKSVKHVLAAAHKSAFVTCRIIQVTNKISWCQVLLMIHT